MLSNKFLTLGLGALLLSSAPSFAARTGSETGGGGDAVMINGKAVIRDVVITGNMTTVENNTEFLKSIKGFKTLIESIAKINPDFASDIVIDLSKVTFYLSDTNLPLLSYGQTTMPGGVAAEIQLAARTGSDVVLAPQFFENEYTKYTLVHEALHGLLKNNAGPAHHQRVRNIVNYLYKNRTSLTAEGLDEVLKNNNYSAYIKREKEVWNKNLDSTVRCHFAVTGSEMAHVGLFENVDCASNILEKAALGAENRDYLELFKERDALIEARFPGITQLYKASYSLEKKEIPYVKELTLQKDSIFKSNVTSIQKGACWDSQYNQKRLVELKAMADEKMSQLGKLDKSLEAASLSSEVKDKLVKSVNYLATYDRATLPQMQKEISEVSSLINERLETATKNTAKCQKQYPN